MRTLLAIGLPTSWPPAPAYTQKPLNPLQVQGIHVSTPNGIRTRAATLRVSQGGGGGTQRT